MKRRSTLPDLLLRAALAVLCTYAVLGGATGGGLLTPQYRVMTLIFLALLAAAWLIIRWRREWVWFHLPLDRTFLLWGLAIGVSALANLDSWPRILIGITFAAVYLGIWYIAQDSIANKALKRQTLIESLLTAGLIVLIFGYAQVFRSFRTVGLRLAAIPRVTSTLENPNFLGTFLMLLIPLALGYLLAIRSRFARILLGFYTVLAALLLFITQSRSAWAGAAAGLGVFVLLLLSHYHLLSRQQFMDWWRAQSPRVRASIWGLLTINIIIGSSLLVWLIRSLSMSGRTLDLRTYIYDAAIQMFREKPLTGYGLFTFGRGLIRLASTPPYTPHNSAHNLPLNVGSELGVIGLFALVVTGIVIVWAMRRNWQAANESQRLLLVGTMAASAGLAVDHLLDYTTTLTPVVALAAILTLVLATAPVSPKPVACRWGTMRTVALAVMWLALLVGVFRNTAVYGDYVTALRYSTQADNPREVTRRLQAVIDAEPSMPIYPLYQGYFFAVAALQGDTTAAPQGIADYARFCDLEPYYAPAWANLGALRWQVGQREQAVKDMERAAQLAPLSWEILYNLGTYYEQTGAVDLAHQTYVKVLTINSSASLYPEWSQTALRDSFAKDVTHYSNQARIVYFLNAGNLDEAQQVWQQLPVSEQDQGSSRIIGGILELATNDRSAAAAQFALAEKTPSDTTRDLWIHLGKAYLARFDGDLSTAAQEIRNIQVAIPQLSSEDEDRISAITFAQFWSVGLRQYFVPQVYSRSVNALFMNLLERVSDETF